MALLEVRRNEIRTITVWTENPNQANDILQLGLVG